MLVVHSEDALNNYLRDVYAELPDTPSILIDDFIEGAQEAEVDALADGQRVVVAGIMEHIEGAGIHSGDSACITPPVSLSQTALEKIHDYSVRLTEAIGVKGLINIQYVIKGDEVWIIEANPRASRTIPYLSKAIGHPLAKYAALIAAGKTLDEIGLRDTPTPHLYSVKESVLPFHKFRRVLPILGPEMRSTGESMGIDEDPYLAYYKAQLGAGSNLPHSGKVLVLGSARQTHRSSLEALGFEILEEADADPDADPDYQLLITSEAHPELRRALENAIPYASTPAAARWTLEALRAAQARPVQISALQARKVATSR